MKTFNHPKGGRVERSVGEREGEWPEAASAREQEMMWSAAELHEVISAHKLFRGMKAEHLQILADGARSERHEPGAVIFAEGEPADALYLIHRGKVMLEAHRPKRPFAAVQTLGPGQAMGWSWLFPPFVWHLQARALEPTEVVVLNGGHLLVAVERDHEFGYELMKRLVQMVIERLQALRGDLLEREKVAAEEASRDVEI